MESAFVSDSVMIRGICRISAELIPVNFAFIRMKKRTKRREKTVRKKNGFQNWNLSSSIEDYLVLTLVQSPKI